MIEPVADSPLRSPAADEAAPPLAPGEAPPIVRPKPKVTLKDRWRRFPSPLFLILSLAALIALAAFFRFWRISYQSYWTDESYTVYRVHGTFRQMLASLNNQGFPPGWYAILRWWTMLVEFFTHSKFIPLTPEGTRSLTALIGTLTIPAMYFLARQFTDKKGALLACLLTAVNPYLIYYSRDIKMYPAMWFVLILNTAIFFKWQTTHKHLLWFPLFVLTGFLMTAMHTTAWFMVALQLIFLLTRPRLKSLDAPLWLLGVGIMALLPIYWYIHQTNWLEHAVQGRGEAGLSWVFNYTNMSWATIAGLPCSHLLGYLWPSFPPDTYVRRWFELGGSFDKHIATRAWPWMAKMQRDVAIGFAAIMLLGLIPWRGFRRSPERRASVTRYRFWWIGVWIIVPTVCMALTWIPKSSPWHHWVWHSLKVQPIWEPRYLGFLVPAWILWLAAALRRLPTWPLRTVLILAVTAASGFSALSNHLIFRNPPFQIPAQVAFHYYDANKKYDMAIGQLDLTYPGKVVPLDYELAAGLRPFERGNRFPRWQDFSPNLRNNSEAFRFLRGVQHNLRIQTLIFTDRDGDLTAPSATWSNQSMMKRLGPGWTLVDEQKYQLHYEWRFYVFNTWRTRVWKRTPVAPPPAVHAKH